MHSDTNFPYDLLLDLIDLLYQATNHGEISHQLFSSLENFLNFDAAIFTPINWQTLELQSGYRYGEIADDSNFKSYQHAPFDSLLFDPLCLTRLNSTIRLSDQTYNNTLRQTHIDNSQQINDYQHAMGIVASWRQQPVAAIRLYRSADKIDFSEQDRLLLNRVAVHVANAIYLQDTTTALEPLRETGLIVFDQNSQVIYKNEAVSIMLDGIELTTVLSIVQKGNLWLRNGAELYRAEIVPLTTTSLLSVLAKTEDLDIDNQSQDNAENQTTTSKDPGITIISIEPFRRRHAIGNRLKQSGLSQREIEVSLGIMRGLSNSNIAKQLFIDEKTVKDHLQRIYGKIHIKTRTELISKMLGLDIELADDFPASIDEAKEVQAETEFIVSR